MLASAWPEHEIFPAEERLLVQQAHLRPFGTNYLQGGEKDVWCLENVRRLWTAVKQDKLDADSPCLRFIFVILSKAQLRISTWRDPQELQDRCLDSTVVRSNEAVATLTWLRVVKASVTPAAYIQRGMRKPGSHELELTCSRMNSVI